MAPRTNGRNQTPNPGTRNNAPNQKVQPLPITRSKDLAPPAISINTAMPHDDIESSKLVMSPRVHEVSQHAAHLKDVFLQMTALYQMVERQASHTQKMSKVASGLDRLEELQKEFESRQGVREDKFTALCHEIQNTKTKLEQHVKDRISSLISECVAQEVKEKVKQKLDKELAKISEIKHRNELKLLGHKQYLENVEARNVNSILRSHFPTEKLHDVPRVIPPSSQHSSQDQSSIVITRSLSRGKCPKTFGELLQLGPADLKVLMKYYDLQESKNSGEDAMLDNLNSLMGHYGIGYRVNPANPKPILSSIWDKY